MSILAEAQLLAAKALLIPGHVSGKIDGETSILTDGKPVHFGIRRASFGAASDKMRLEGIEVMPIWLDSAVVIVTAGVFLDCYVGSGKAAYCQWEKNLAYFVEPDF